MNVEGAGVEGHPLLEPGRVVKVRVRWLTSIEVIEARIVHADKVGVTFKRTGFATERTVEFVPWTSVVTVTQLTTGGGGE